MTTTMLNATLTHRDISFQYGAPASTTSIFFTVNGQKYRGCRFYRSAATGYAVLAYECYIIGEGGDRDDYHTGYLNRDVPRERAIIAALDAGAVDLGADHGARYDLLDLAA